MSEQNLLLSAMRVTPTNATKKTTYIRKRKVKQTKFSIRRQRILKKFTTDNIVY